MNIRVTQRALSKQYLGNMHKTLSEMNNIGSKITAQRKFLRASENSMGAARAIIIRRTLANLQTYDDNLSTAAGIFSSAETNLLTVSGQVSTVTTKILEGVNGDKGQDERDIIATELEGIAENIMKSLNAEYADRKLFGGTNNSGKAFDYVDGKVLFNGTEINTNYDFFTASGKTYVADADKEVTSTLLDAGFDPDTDTLDAGKTYYIDAKDVTVGKDAGGSLTYAVGGKYITDLVKTTKQIVVSNSLVTDGDGNTYLDPKQVDRASNALGFSGTSSILIDIGLGIEYDADGVVDPTTALDISMNGADLTGSGTDSDGDSLNVLQLTYDAAQALRDGDVTKATTLIDKINSARSTLLNGITNLGVKEASIENYKSRTQTEVISLQAAQVEVEGMSTEDLAEYYTQYTMIEAAYNAILQMGAKVVPTSLFDFIN